MRIVKAGLDPRKVVKGKSRALKTEISVRDEYGGDRSQKSLETQYDEENGPYAQQNISTIFNRD